MGGILVCVCVCVCVSLADTFSDGSGGLDFERSVLGVGMSQRSTAKRFITALNTHAQRTHTMLYDLTQLRSLAKDLNIQVTPTHTPLSVAFGLTTAVMLHVVEFKRLCVCVCVCFRLQTLKVSSVL